MSETRTAGETLDLIRQVTIHAITVHGRLGLRDEVRRILDGGNEWQEEAAAKHIDRLRQVREETWDEGALAYSERDMTRAEPLDNPYRTAS